MRILITGGFGFLGGRLALHLQQAGHKILVGSRNASILPDWLPQAEVIHTDWLDRGNSLERICSGVDVLIHAAGMNAQNCFASPVEALEFNGMSTARLVSAASMMGVKRFIYLSTAHVYANPLVGIITEETCPRNLHPYATSHLAGENVVLGASQRGQIEGVVLRLSNAFGVPVDKAVNCWMLLVNDLCRQAVQNRKLLLQTSGIQQRDFIGLTDVCRVVEQVVVYKGASIQTSIFNLGLGVSHSVLSMAQLIQQRCTQVLGFEPLLQYKQPTGDEQHSMLIYRNDKIASFGIISNSTDNITEIDELLRFCKSAFS